MINLKHELLNYPQIDIDSFTDKGHPIPDNVISSINLYNKALENIRQSSEDIAIIELKKAISMNTNFHEAMNLLGVCYIFTKEFSKAAEILEKVASAEKNGVKAQNYLNIINSGNTQEFDNMGGSIPSGISKQDNLKIKSAFKSVSSHLMIGEKEERNNGILLKLASAFVAGIVVMFILSFLFKTVPEDVDVTGRLDEAPTTSQQEIDEIMEQKVKELEDMNRNLESQLAKSISELDYFKNISRLSEVENLNAAKKYEAAADILVAMKSINFKEEDKIKYDKLYGSIAPKAAWTVFSEGNNLSLNKKYQEAVVKLSKVPVYGNDWSYMDATYYRLGVSYKGLNQTQKALEVFNKLVAEFPDSQFSQYAKYRIKELTGTP